MILLFVDMLIYVGVLQDLYVFFFRIVRVMVSLWFCFLDQLFGFFVMIVSGGMFQDWVVFSNGFSYVDFFYVRVFVRKFGIDFVGLVVGGVQVVIYGFYQVYGFGSDEFFQECVGVDVGGWWYGVFVWQVNFGVEV